MESLNVNVAEQKARILSYIINNGPVVGQNVSRQLNIQSFLASALISELLREKKVKASHLRVGGSPLYFVSNQEEKLDNYTKFIAFKEREAFKMLNESGVLGDAGLDPPIRVALRNIKDFAVPLSVSQDGVNRLFWKFHTLPSEEAQNKVKDLIKKSPRPKVVEKKEEVSQVKTQELMPDSPIVKSETKTQKTKKKKSSNLPLKVNEWMAKEGIKMREEIETEGKIFKAVVEVKSAIGSLDFLLIAINKKSVNEGELALCYQEGIERKLPVLLLMNGKPSKKGQKILEGFKGHVTMRKL